MSAPSYMTPGERLRVYTEQFMALKWQLMCELRVASPGIVQSFNAEKQTVTVKLAIRENMVLNAKVIPTDVDTLVDVPILPMRAGGFAITFPVAVGDECLVVFGDNCMDSWFQSGGVGNIQVDRRRHDLSDGFAILGPASNPKALQAYATSSLQIRKEDGSIFIEITPTTINIFNPSGLVKINGGTVDIGDNVTIDGKAFLTHQHIGVQPGGGDSGPVL